MVWRIALTDEAERDLENLVAFLARKSRVAAEAIGLELVVLIFSLGRFPDRGASMRKHPTLRKLAHRHYLVIYRVTKSVRLVEIVRIWDNRQNPDRLGDL
jgi:plasmid stabilization system protein ParE